MKYSIFPGTSENVSSIGFGTWVIGGENWGGSKEVESLEALDRAISTGMTLIDCAPFYGDGLSEKIVGKAIKGKRDKIFLATKCGLIRHLGRVSICLDPQSIQKEVDASRERLGVDQIDLYQCHWPDKTVSVERSMEALSGLQKKGVIRHIGVCNFTLELLKKACVVASVRTLQVQYSLIERSIEDELLPYCIENHIGIIAYGSMGGGVLSGKYIHKPQFAKSDARSMFYKFFTEDQFESVTEYIHQLKRFGRPLDQLALNWVRQQEGVMTVLAGCRTSQQASQNAASADWDLLKSELEELSKLRAG